MSKIFIQDNATGCFFGKGGRWSKCQSGALAFKDEIRARDYCIYHRMANVSLLKVAEPGSEPAGASAPVAGVSLTGLPGHDCAIPS
jgi:hypothetical protein